MRYRSLILIFIITTSCLVISCSKVQNRTKKAESNKATIKLQVKERSTTQGSQTTQELNEDIEKKLNKSLTQLLISGASKVTLFKPDALKNAETTFVDHTKAQDNSAEVSYYYLQAPTNEESLVVAQVNQKVSVQNKMQTYSGKIFLDSDGIILGYDFALTQSGEQ